MRAGIFLLLDECYVYLHYAGTPVSGGSFVEAKEHVIVLGSLSKTYAMTGWRAGFALGPKPIIAAMSKLQSQSTSSTAAIVQKAAIAALSGSQACVTEMRADYLKLRDRHSARPAGNPRHYLHQAGGRVLCLPQCVVVPGQTGREEHHGTGLTPAARSACGRGSRGGIWHPGAHPPVLRCRAKRH